MPVRLRMRAIEPARHRWDAQSLAGAPAPPGRGERGRFRLVDGPWSRTVVLVGDAVRLEPGSTAPVGFPAMALRVTGDATRLQHHVPPVPPVRGAVRPRCRRGTPGGPDGAPPGRGPRGRKTRPATYHGGMSFLRRNRAATPAGPDFDVLAMDPGDWPGNLGAGLLPAPDGSCQGVFLRYDLFGGRGPAMIIGNLPEGSPARDLAEGQVPFEVAQLLDALENEEDVEVTGVEDCPVMQGDNLLIVRKIKLSEGRISCVQFDRSDNVLVTIASWDRPITDDLYALLKPLPAELFQQG